MFWAEDFFFNIQQANKPLEQYVEEFERFTPADFINHVLALNNSKFYFDMEDSNPPPIRKHADAPAHHQPASLPPFLPRFLQSSRAPPSSSAQNSSQPAAPPRSGPLASNMASHICHKDVMDQFGLLFPFPPTSPLVLSSPPEPERRPEHPPEPAPPEHPPEPAPPKPGPPVLSWADNTLISSKKILAGGGLPSRTVCPAMAAWTVYSAMAPRAP
ncbi:hypothetical protein M9458_057533 [Cirrhinus mrigala]|uniref:Uncharacterized protein n=1 Tax=Cirrhinus mrigala TaxID=683832 RepID=A0ABD0MDT3_CIRMR